MEEILSFSSGLPKITMSDLLVASKKCPQDCVLVLSDSESRYWEFKKIYAGAVHACRLNKSFVRESKEVFELENLVIGSWHYVPKKILLVGV